MSTMRFNHMELTFPKGTFTDDFRADLESFYGGVLGWNVIQTQVLKIGQLPPPARRRAVHPARGSRQAHGVAGARPSGPAQDTREEVDEMLDRCERFQEKDDRVKIRTFNDLVTGNVVVHAFYVKHLLPIWFDIQIIERAEGSPGPAKSWVYT